MSLEDQEIYTLTDLCDGYRDDIEKLEKELDYYKKDGFRLSQALASVTEHADLKIGDIIFEGAVDYVRSMEQQLSEASAAIRWMEIQILRGIDLTEFPGYERNKIAIERALKG